MWRFVTQIKQGSEIPVALVGFLSRGVGRRGIPFFGHLIADFKSGAVRFFDEDELAVRSSLPRTYTP